MYQAFVSKKMQPGWGSIPGCQIYGNWEVPLPVQHSFIA
jgi:hypothetical protein